MVLQPSHRLQHELAAPDSPLGAGPSPLWPDPAPPVPPSVPVPPPPSAGHRILCSSLQQRLEPFGPLEPSPERPEHPPPGGFLKDPVRVLLSPQPLSPYQGPFSPRGRDHRLVRIRVDVMNGASCRRS